MTAHRLQIKPMKKIIFALRPWENGKVSIYSRGKSGLKESVNSSTTKIQIKKK